MSAEKKASVAEAAALEDTDEPSLSKLLGALAMGARAVHNIPLDDDFDYQSSFPEFSQLAKETNASLVQVLGIALQDIESDDPMLWDKCADTCESLLEQAESYSTAAGSTVEPQTLQNLSAMARQKAKGGYGRMMEGIVDMEKPQETYNIQVQNDRTLPFVPRVHPNKPYSKVPLNLELKDGHGLESRIYGRTRAIAANAIAPSQHVSHVYEEELLSLKYLPWQLKAPDSRPPRIVETPVEHLTAKWVDTMEELAKLAHRLEATDRVAVDLEAHSYRSFSGLTCLMQMTVPVQDGGHENFLVDTLKLWHDINAYLAPIFANPNILKVMHGADSDVQWLQRDFGIYVVNMFDTVRAARALPHHPAAGLAHLLKHYVGFDADKSLALSDWRRRPLLDEMRSYAIMDTHYLLDIYEHLMFELEQHQETSVEKVLDDSRNVCLIRYDKEPFQPDGYKLIRRKPRNSRSEPMQQQQVIASLYEWRDATARACDESLHYVCANKALLRIGVACPTTVASLQSLCNPMPPLMMRFSQEILGRIKRCLAADGDDDDAELASPQRGIAGAPSSAFFKPAEIDDDVEERGDNGILSPVLPTEEMYKQAGWMTPQVGDVVTTTTDEDDGDSSSKPRKLLVVVDANKGYLSNEYTAHSIGMGNSWSKKAHRADGLGPARAAGREEDHVDEQAKQAQLNAARIRSRLSQDEALLGPSSPATELVGDRAGDVSTANAISKVANVDDDSDEEFVIPKSVAEIYKISNQNRRNRNSISPTNLERGGIAPEQMDVDTPDGAKAAISDSGYYGGGIGGKRQRTKSDAGEGKSGASLREENIEFMKGLGWIKSKEELEAKMSRPRGEEAAAESACDGSADRVSPADESRASKGSSIGNKSGSPFDYSSVGPIGVCGNPNGPATANPFFGGAAVAPIPNGQTGTPKRLGADRKKGPGRGKAGKSGKQERPEKRDGMSFVYRKR